MTAHKKLGELFDINVEDFILNIFLFIPFGFLLSRLRLKKHEKHVALFVILTGCVTSIGIETTQIFLDRFTSLTDVLSNTFGSFLGYWISRFLLSDPGKKLCVRCKIGFLQWAGYGLLVLLILLFYYYPLHVNQDLMWSEDYPLLIGNENSSDRPWDGDIAFLGLYDQALPSLMARSHYLSMIDSSKKSRAIDPSTLLMVPFYEQGGDSVFAFNRDGEKVIFTESQVQRIAPHGISLKQGCLKSLGTPAFICRDVQAAGEFSIEAYLRPDNITQTGPARIFSYSANVNRRNFTLGQEGTALVFRVRTPRAGWNGSDLQLWVGDVFSTEWTHVLVTFKHGTMTAYVNGIQAGEPVTFMEEYLIHFYKFDHRPGSVALWIFMTVFPLALFFPRTKRVKSLLTPIAVPVLILSFIQWAFSFRTGEPWSIFMTLMGIAAAITGTWIQLLYREHANAPQNRKDLTV